MFRRNMARPETGTIRGARGTARPTFSALLLVVLCLITMQAVSAEISVFAAASLTDALKEAAAIHEKEKGDKIVLNLGASSTLARQIEEGAPADVFFSADEAQMDKLEKKGMLASGTRKSLLSNSLVIVVASKDGAAVSSPADLAKPEVRRIALGDPKSVPIGVYAREFLEQQHLWASIKPKLVLTENVRAAVAAVASGNADASIVYKTDAAISRQVKIAFEVAREEGPKISYPVALVKESKQRVAATVFVQFLESLKGREVFRKHGFIVPD
jgi:molybdate transport system substrate-binding protein